MDPVYLGAMAYHSAAVTTNLVLSNPDPVVEDGGIG